MIRQERPSWDEYFMTLADEVATRTTCLRRAVGAIIVKEKRILATGYNGVPTGLRHCSVTGTRRSFGPAPRNLPRTARRTERPSSGGALCIDIEGSSIYITTQPCVVCAKMLINAGISEIIYRNPYPDELAMELLNESNIKIRIFDGQTSKSE